MLDLHQERLLAVRDLRRHPAFRQPDGRPCAPAKIYRAFNPGYRAADGNRIRLEHARLPAGCVSSEEAVERFIEKLTHGLPVAEPPRGREAAHA